MEDVQLGDPHLPLWWYDRWYSDTRWIDLISPSSSSSPSPSSSTEDWHVFPGPESSCDLWLLYLDHDDDHQCHTRSPPRYMHISVNGGCDRTVRVRRSIHSLPTAVQFRANSNSLITKNRIHLCSSTTPPPSSQQLSPVVYELDMHGDYAQQTRSTPFVVSSHLVYK